MTTNAPLLAVQNLCVEFHRRGRDSLRAVNDISFEVGTAETVGVVGESGSGKSTTARAVIGLQPVSAGRIVFDGADITNASGRRRSALARSIQYVFQDPYSSLNPTRTIADTLSEPLLNAGIKTRADRLRRVGEILELVGMPDDTARRYPGAFSGGQRQRIAIARAVICSPRLVICDEPTSALDLSIQAQILTLLKDLQHRYSISYLFISHNLDVVRYMAERTVVMNQGRIVEEGRAYDIATRPTDPYTQALVAATPLADPAAQAARRAARRPTQVATA